MKLMLNLYEDILSPELSVRPNSVSGIRQRETPNVPSASISERRSCNAGIASDSQHCFDVRSRSACLWPHPSTCRIAFTGGAAGGTNCVTFGREADYSSPERNWPASGSEETPGTKGIRAGQDPRSEERRV